MDEVNPYAAPRTPRSLDDKNLESDQPAQDESWDRLWRDSRNRHLLVMDKDASIPRCVKSGGMVTASGVVRDFSWHNPLIAATFLFPPIYIFFATIYDKRATIAVPLCEEEQIKRKNQLLASWRVGLSSVAMVSICGLLDHSNQSNAENWHLALGMLLGIVGVFTAFFAGNSAARILRPVKITDTKVWFRGVHPSILEKLPLLPKQHEVNSLPLGSSNSFNQHPQASSQKPPARRSKQSNSRLPRWS